MIHYDFNETNLHGLTKGDDEFVTAMAFAQDKGKTIMEDDIVPVGSKLRVGAIADCPIWFNKTGHEMGYFQIVTKNNDEEIMLKDIKRARDKWEFGGKKEYGYTRYLCTPKIVFEICMNFSVEFNTPEFEEKLAQHYPDCWVNKAIMPKVKAPVRFIMPGVKGY